MADFVNVVGWTDNHGNDYLLVSESLERGPQRGELISLEIKKRLGEFYGCFHKYVLFWARILLNKFEF